MVDSLDDGNFFDTLPPLLSPALVSPLTWYSSSPHHYSAIHDTMDNTMAMPHLFIYY
jgi:hypothetical protein